MATTVFEATDVQVRLFETVRDGRYRIIGFGGGIRGTKTWGMLGIVLTLCRVFPRSRWAIVRKDLPTLRRNTVPSFNKLREEYFGEFVSEINQSDWTATCSNGSQIIFFSESLDIDPDLSRWKGLEVNGFLLEEADELAEKSYHKAIERSGSWIVPNGGEQPPPYVLCTFNPCANWPKHVFYEPWQNGTIAPPYAFIPATAADNPFVPEATREAWKSLPEQEYKRFVEGDWNVLTGRYYDGIDRRVHLIPRSAIPATIPAWWTCWGAFDWGYSHWAVFGAFTQDGDGNVFLLDSVWQRKGQDADYAATILDADTVPADCRVPIYAGHDCWAVQVARGATGITTHQVFAQHGLGLVRADIDKVNGGRALRRQLAFKRDPETGAITQAPKLYLIDTPGNQRLFNQLAEIMPDENNVEKPGKVDADSEGRGGDDGADMLRYGIASRRIQTVDPILPTIDSDRHPGWQFGRGGRIEPKHIPHAADAIDRASGGRGTPRARTPNLRMPR